VSFDIQLTTVPALRDIMGRFSSANAATVSQRLSELRALGQSMVQALQAEAPKNTGAFAAGIHFRTFDEGAGRLVLRTYSPRPLGEFIIRGTQAHPIRARQGKALTFFWPQGPQGPGTYSFKQVQHPGTQPNPYHQRAFDAHRGQMHEVGRKMARAYRVHLKGK
jgi:hypothetical protein